MRAKLNRRRLLTTAIAGAGVSMTSALPMAALAQAAEPGIAARRLSDNLLLITGAGCNVLALTGPDGVLMVDSGRAEAAADLLAFVDRQSGGRPVEVVFNTHWHPEQTGANDRLGKAGARIIAHENTRLWMTTEFRVPWQDRVYSPRAPQARPADTFYTEDAMRFAGEDIVYGHLPRAHTDGDIYVFFRKANVLAAGGVVSGGHYPILDYATGGWPGGMKDACKTLLDLVDDDTRIIPESGPVRGRADLRAQYDMVSEMMERMVAMMKKGMSAKDMLAAGISDDFDARWGDPGLFVANGYQGLWGHVVGELGIF